MSLKEYKRIVDNKELPSVIVVLHPRDSISQDRTTIKWNGLEWIRLEYFVCDENLAPPPDFTCQHDMEREHYEILLSEYGLTLEDVDIEKLPKMSPSELAIIVKKVRGGKRMDKNTLTTRCVKCGRKAIVEGIHEEPRPAEGDEAKAGIVMVILIKGTEHCYSCGHISYDSVVDRKYLKGKDIKR